MTAGANSTITLGNGTDTVIAGATNVISLGNGADTVYAASGDTITVGNGHDTFVFGLSPGRTAAGMIGPVTINHCGTANDVIEIASTRLGIDTISLASRHTFKRSAKRSIALDATSTRSRWSACLRLACMRVTFISSDHL